MGGCPRPIQTGAHERRPYDRARKYGPYSLKQRVAGQGINSGYSSDQGAALASVDDDAGAGYEVGAL